MREPLHEPRVGRIQEISAPEGSYNQVLGTYGNIKGEIDGYIDNIFK